ncbi:MAG: PAS domain S-box protein [Cytophagaceae bacterium]|nr:MAG: PAS domain S-box protein [Cytophagaceae bacterium]
MPTLPAAPAADLFPADEALRALLAVSVAGVVLYLPVRDAAGAITDFAFAYLSPVAQRLLRLPAQPVTTTLVQHFPQSVANGSLAFHRDAFLAGEPAHFELSYQGEGFDDYYRVAAQRVGAGLLVSFTTAADHPQRAAEAALQASKAREQAARAEAERQRGELQRIVEQAPVAIAVYRGPQYTIELANPLVCALWGRTQAQAVGTPLFELLPEVAGQGYEELLAGVLATGEPHVAQEMPSIIDRNGRRDTVYWNFVYLPTRAADGGISGVMVVATEVSEQVHARQRVQELHDQLAVANQALHLSNADMLANQEELLLVQQQLEHLNQQLGARVAERTQQVEAALAEAERQRAHATEQRQLLSQILGQVPASIATLSGPAHRYSFFNEGYQALSGGRTRLGHTVAEVLPEVVDQGFVGLLDQVYATGQPFVGAEMPVQLYDAATGRPEPRYVDFIYQPLRGEQGHTVGVLAFILDVTDKVVARQQVQHLNATLQATNERLRRTNADLDTFVYTASHDLKAPITNIEGLLDALRTHLPAAPPAPLVPQLLAMMQEAVERFQATIAQLTDVARLHHLLGQEAEEVNLADLVAGVRLDLAPLLEVAGTQLVVDLAACPTVHFLAKNLRSILYNLLSNAVKYRAPGRPSVVQLRCTSTASHIVLEVQDNGLGLSEQQQARLFVLFRRLHDHVEGSGVGLYMVKRIVENAGGTITVQSQPGAGATFSVSLPRTRPA